MVEVGNDREMTHEEFLAKHMMKLSPDQLSDIAALLRYEKRRTIRGMMKMIQGQVETFYSLGELRHDR